MAAAAAEVKASGVTSTFLPVCANSPSQVSSRAVLQALRKTCVCTKLRTIRSGYSGMQIVCLMSRIHTEVMSVTRMLRGTGKCDSQCEGTESCNWLSSGNR